MSRTGKATETENNIEVARIWGGRRARGDCLTDAKSLFRVTKRFWKEMVVMVVPHCEYTNNLLIVPFKMIFIPLREHDDMTKLTRENKNKSE